MIKYKIHVFFELKTQVFILQQPDDITLLTKIDMQVAPDALNHHPLFFKILKSTMSDVLHSLKADALAKGKS